jgi:hypothetical protein
MTTLFEMPAPGKKIFTGATVAALALTMIAGCANRGPRTEATEAPAMEAAAEAEPAAAPAPAKVAAKPAAKPAPAAAPVASGAQPGMNANGEVVDSSKVTAGSGRKVKGLGNWEGEITGKPAPSSRFTKLEIGMSMRQVVDLIGPPTDQGGYITGRSFIPFYFGSDRHRFEMAYKGQGRLIFAGGSIGDFTGGNLIWIIHNANDSGYR